MNLEQIAAKEQETYPDQREKGVDGAEDGLGLCDRRDLLCKIRGLDSCVQFLDSALPQLRFLELGFHGRNSRWQREKCQREGCGEDF